MTIYSELPGHTNQKYNRIHGGRDYARGRYRTGRSLMSIEAEKTHRGMIMEAAIEIRTFLMEGI